MAAAYTDFTVDQTSWTTDEKTKAKKALAYFFKQLNPDNTLNISSPATLNALWQKKIVQDFKCWYKQAVDYESSIANNTFSELAEE